MKTQVFLLKDILNVGMAGEIVGVNDGFATNYIMPRKLGIIVTDKNKAEIEGRIKKVEKRIEVIKSKTSMLAENIKSLKITLKTKVHDDGKLYGAIRPQMIVDELAKEGISIAKNMVIFGKQIKEKGTHEVIIKLSTTLQPTLTVKVVPE
jgi:large subunit ribosomal protein L9